MQLVLGYGYVRSTNVCVILVQIHRAFASGMRDEKVPGIYVNGVIVVEEMKERSLHKYLKFGHSFIIEKKK